MEVSVAQCLAPASFTPRQARYDSWSYLMRSTLLVFALLASTALSHAATISTFAGTGVKGFSGDGGEAAAAQLSDPNGIARGPDGALYICDTMNHRVRKVTRDGRIVTVAGSDSTPPLMTLNVKLSGPQ